MPQRHKAPSPSAEQILDWRRKRKLSQSEFWAPIGVTQSAGSRYESGRPLPIPIALLLDLVYGPPKRAEKLLDKLRTADK